MQKWQYLVLELITRYGTAYSGKEYIARSNGDFIMEGDKELNIFEYLDDLGKAGWELVSTDMWRGEDSEINKYHFKRPVE